MRCLSVRLRLHSPQEVAGPTPTRRYGHPVKNTNASNGTRPTINSALIRRAYERYAHGDGARRNRLSGRLVWSPARSSVGLQVTGGGTIPCRRRGGATLSGGHGRECWSLAPLSRAARAQVWHLAAPPAAGGRVEVAATG